MRTLIGTLALLTAAAAAAPALAAPVTIESYYRIKWGSDGEFKALYAKNHKPLLDELRHHGFITAIKAEAPFTHMACGPRWDLRVTIIYRDGALGHRDWRRLRQGDPRRR